MKEFGHKLADKISRFTGSWEFVILFMLFTGFWCLCLESTPWPRYTAVVSTLAIVMSSLILLATSRQADLDRSNTEINNKKVDEQLKMLREQMKLLRGIEEELQEDD